MQTGWGRTDLICYALKIKHSKRRQAPDDPLPIPLPALHGVPQQAQILQMAELPQGLEVAEVRDIVVRED